MRIATDLHDDIGSSLSQIAIMSEVAQRMVAGPPSSPLDRIAEVSRQALASIGDIIWAIDPERDSLTDLTQRMRRFANDLFGSGEMGLRFHAAAAERDIGMGADARRQVFLIFKEALHNVAKHSGATAVDVQLRLEKDTLMLRIADNGRGFDTAASGHGHGLRSMAARASQIGGELQVTSDAGGSTVLIRIPIERRWLAHYTHM
jgi:signal transduction histidine kinase